MSILVSRKQAIESGIMTYYTGKVCKKGHTTERYTNSGICIGCNKERKPYYKKWHSINSEKQKERSKNYYAIKKNDEAYIANKKRITKNWRENNKEHLREYGKQQRILKRASKYANNAQRRANKLRAMPKWTDLGAIKKIYENCPKGYHVDHIIPLRNKLVCGLHVPDNLQYLTAKENLQKNNSFTPFVEIKGE